MEPSIARYNCPGGLQVYMLTGTGLGRAGKRLGEGRERLGLRLGCWWPREPGERERGCDGGKSSAGKSATFQESSFHVSHIAGQPIKLDGMGAEVHHSPEQTISSDSHRQQETKPGGGHGRMVAGRPTETAIIRERAHKQNTAARHPPRAGVVAPRVWDGGRLCQSMG